jgi:hypothetical protein
MPTYAAKATDGAGMPVTNQYGSYDLAKNNRGTMKSNGVSSNLLGSVRTSRPVVSTFASTPMSSGVTVVDYATSAIGAGTFAKETSRPLSTLVTTSLAGLPNRALTSPGNDQNSLRSINKQEVITSRLATTGIRAGNFNFYTGKFTVAPTVRVDNWAPANSTTLSATTTDTAANVSRTSPGKLTYRRGGPVPFRDNYKTKTS